jgi:RNase P subunit RPR2
MKQLVDGQQVRIHLARENSEGLVTHTCCGCGLKHNLYVGRIDKDVTLAFVRIAENKERTKGK